MDYFKHKERGKLIYLYKEYNTNSFLKKADEYLKIYPDDIDIRYKKATMYRRIGEFDKAIEELKYSLNIKNNTDKKLYTDCLVYLFFIYYHLNMYKEALELVPLLYEKGGITPYSVSIAELVMKTQLGIPMKVKKGTRGDYVKSQIFNYSSSLAFSHIQDHLYDDTEGSKFNENIDLAYLLKVVRKNIDNSKKVNVNEVLEVHCFAIPNIGCVNDIGCNYIKVVVVPNTNNVITMYPTNIVIDNIAQILDYDHSLLFRQEEKEKTKTLSRIDRFKKKYNM